MGLTANGSENASIVGRSCLMETSTMRVVSVKIHDPTDFRRACGVDSPSKTISSSLNGTVISWSARDEVLKRCGQTEPLCFDEHFNERTLPSCKKIGEGVYGEVFMYSTKSSKTVLKVIPIEGDICINDAAQKTFAEILSEIVISMELSNLRYGEKNQCDGFVEVRQVRCVRGKYPAFLLKLWDEYNLKKRSENDNPKVFEDTQLYIVLELVHGGIDLEAFVFKNSKQAFAAFQQASLSLAVAEKALEFEHRDLHWGNILLSQTEEPSATFILDGREFTISTEGVKVSIIDFTLSRMTYDGCSIYNDLSLDPDLFRSEGSDYQFEIYRLMQKETCNDWERFYPRTNIFWLHYVLDKMCSMVHYKNERSQVHGRFLKKLSKYKKTALQLESATDMAIRDFKTW